jgi:adenylate cyclase
VLFLAGVPLLDQVELKTYDMRLRSLPPAPPRHVTIAAIDEASLAKLGRWPWSRATLARLAERLDQAGARVIAFDVFFSERESPAADGQFARAIGATRKVVLGTLFLLDQRETRHVGEGGLEAAQRAIASQAITHRISGEAPDPRNVREPHGVLVNIPELQAAAAYSGHINVTTDEDGVVRRAPLVVRYGGRYFPAFDIQVARAYLPGHDVSVELAAYGVASVNVGGRYVPLDEDGQLLVRYRGPVHTFPAVSVADILEERADTALLRDRIVLVGSTAKAMEDLRVTPYGPAFPGVEVRASIVENLVEGEILNRPQWMTLVDVAALLVLGVALAWIVPRIGVLGGAVLSVGALAAYIAAALYLFQGAGLWLNLVYPSLLVMLVFAAATLVQYFFRVSEQRYLKRAFAHYVPPAVVDDLVADAGKLRLGGEKRELTVLFSDIRGFTTLAEGMEPEELVKLMNEYLTAMTQEVFRQRGSLDKYIGDAVMAIFGAPVAEPEHPRLACRAALGMMSALRTLQGEWRKEGKPSFEIGIGINTGPMVVGNMGSASRFNYTVVGDAVNLASRIESLNKTYGTNILVSESTYKRVRDEFRATREVDRVQVRGRARPVRLYELIPEGRYATLDWLDEYRAAYDAKRAGEVARASAAFQALHARVGDPVSAYHARTGKIEEVVPAKAGT